MTWTPLAIPFAIWLPIGFLLGVFAIGLSPTTTAMVHRLSRLVPWQIYCLAAIFFAGFAFCSIGNWGSVLVFAALTLLQLVCCGLAAWRDLGRLPAVQPAAEAEDHRRG